MNRIKHRILCFVMTAVMIFCSTPGCFTVNADKKTEYPVCYGKFTYDGQEMIFPVVVHDNTVYVNVWDFEAYLGYTALSYQNILSTLSRNAMEYYRDDMMCESVYFGYLNSIASLADFTVSSFGNKTNIFSGLMRKINNDAEDNINRIIKETKDTYVLERSSASKANGISWYIDVGTKKVFAAANNKLIKSYTLDSEIISTSAEEFGKHDVWIPFDALCTMFNSDWLICDGAIDIGTDTENAYAEEFIFDDYSNFAITEEVYENWDGVYSITGGILDLVSDTLELSSFSSEAWKSYGVTSDEYDYLAKSILYVDSLEQESMKDEVEQLAKKAYPMINDIFGSGDTVIQDVLKNSSKEDIDILKSALNATDETFENFSKNVGKADLLNRGINLLADAYLEYSYAECVNQDSVDALNAFCEAYNDIYCNECDDREYCEGCRYREGFRKVTIDDNRIADELVDELSRKYENETFLYNIKTGENLPHDNCWHLSVGKDNRLNQTGNVPCKFMVNMSEAAETYNSNEWEETFWKNAAVDTVGSYALDKLLSGITIVKAAKITNTGWKAAKDMILGENVQNWYQAIGYLGPAVNFENDSYYLLSRYRQDYKTGNDIKMLRNLTYANLKAYYIANSQVDVIFKSTDSSYSFPAERMDALTEIIAEFSTSAALVESEYIKKSKEIIESNVLCQQVDCTVSDAENKTPVEAANLEFTAENGEVFTVVTDESGKTLNIETYVPVGTYNLKVTAYGYETYEHPEKVEVKVDEVCRIKEIGLKENEDYYQIALGMIDTWIMGRINNDKASAETVHYKFKSEDQYLGDDFSLLEDFVDYEIPQILVTEVTSDLFDYKEINTHLGEKVEKVCQINYRCAVIDKKGNRHHDGCADIMLKINGKWWYIPDLDIIDTDYYDDAFQWPKYKYTEIEISDDTFYILENGEKISEEEAFIAYYGYSVTKEQDGTFTLTPVTGEKLDDEKWKQLYKEALMKLVSDGWTMDDNNTWKGSRFCLEYFNNSDIPDLFVSHDNANHADGKVYSVYNGELVCSDIMVHYGSLSVDVKNKVGAVNANTTLMPELVYYVFKNGKVAEKPENYSEKDNTEWISISPDKVFDESVIEKELGLAENENFDDKNKIKENTVYYGRYVEGTGPAKSRYTMEFKLSGNKVIIHETPLMGTPNEYYFDVSDVSGNTYFLTNGKYHSNTYDKNISDSEITVNDDGSFDIIFVSGHDEIKEHFVPDNNDSDNQSNKSSSTESVTVTSVVHTEKDSFLNLRKESNTNGSPIGEIGNGTEIYIDLIKSVEGWYYAKCRTLSGEEMTGYVSADYVELDWKK